MSRGPDQTAIQLRQSRPILPLGPGGVCLGMSHGGPAEAQDHLDASLTLTLTLTLPSTGTESEAWSVAAASPAQRRLAQSEKSSSC